MIAPVRDELLRNLDEWLYENIRLIEEDPDEWYHRMEHFLTYCVYRSFREGERAALHRVTVPSGN